MTDLQRRALAGLPLPADAVERIYHRYTSGHGHPDRVVQSLCESHERLRAELEGTQVLLAEAEAEVTRLRAALEALAADNADVEVLDPHVNDVVALRWWAGWVLKGGA